MVVVVVVVGVLVAGIVAVVRLAEVVIMVLVVAVVAAVLEEAVSSLEADVTGADPTMADSLLDGSKCGARAACGCDMLQDYLGQLRHHHRQELIPLKEKDTDAVLSKWVPLALLPFFALLPPLEMLYTLRISLCIYTYTHRCI